MFGRYVSLGSLADGSRVFWDTKEDVGVKLVAQHWKRRRRRAELRGESDDTGGVGESGRNGRAEPTTRPRVKRGTRHGAATATSYGPERSTGALIAAMLGMSMAAVVCIIMLDGTATRHGYHPHRGVGFDLFFDVIAHADVVERITMAAVPTALAMLLCWLWHGVFYGSPRDYEPATPREVAFATANRGSVGYQLGHWAIHPLLLVMLWSVPANTIARPLLELLPWWNGSVWDRALWWSLASWGVCLLIIALWMKWCDHREERRQMERRAPGAAHENDGHAR